MADTPTNFQLIRWTRKRVRLTWDSIHSSFTVQRKLTSGSTWSDLATIDDKFYTDDSVKTKGERYDYRVVAHDAVPSTSAPTAILNALIPDTLVVFIGDSNSAYAAVGRASPTVTAYASSHTLGLNNRADADMLQPHPQLHGGLITDLAENIEVIHHSQPGFITSYPLEIDLNTGTPVFYGDALGDNYPYEASTTIYPATVPRINAQPLTPGDDYCFYHYGVNDNADFDNHTGKLAPWTIANIEACLDLWVGRGHPAANFIISTVPPQDYGTPRIHHFYYGTPSLLYRQQVPLVNAGIREIVARRGCKLVDSVPFQSNDGGFMYKDISYHANLGGEDDGLHMSQKCVEQMCRLIVCEIKGYQGAASLQNNQIVLSGPPGFSAKYRLTSPNADFNSHADLPYEDYIGPITPADATQRFEYYIETATRPDASRFLTVGDLLPTSVNTRAAGTYPARTPIELSGTDAGGSPASIYYRWV